jgi:DNA-binding sugar fermentation-stimulating protein
MLVYTLPSLQGATVLHRPSKRVRSPYMADIELDDGTIGLCHTPGLGCSGLVVPGKRIYVSENYDTAIKTNWIAHVAEGLSSMIGIHPLTTKEAIYTLLERIHPDAHWTADVMVKYSRMDYVGYLPDGKKVYMELKTVLSESMDKMSVPECKTAKAYTETNVLKQVLALPDTHSCHFLFIVPHSHCDSVVIDVKDKVYHSKMRQAVEAGIHLHAFVLEYDMDGDILFKKEVSVGLS